jgi:hypothetical protein
MSKISVCLAVLLLSFSAARGVRSGEELIEAMYRKYEGKWYQTLTFEQQTIRYGEDGEVVSEEMWHEALRMPDKLAIKIGGMDSGNGMMIRNDSLYQFSEGSMVGTRPMLHPLLVLGFSVYNQPAEKTINDLKVLGVDFEKFHKRMYEGRKVYVVGADEGDEVSTQFWVDRERKLFVRLIQDFGEGRSQDVRFNKYQPLCKAWVSPEVLFYSDGTLRLKEVYTNIRTPELSAEVFNPVTFTESKW